MGEFVTYEKNDLGYAVIHLNRAKKRNAISGEMAKQLQQYVTEAEKQEIKFLVITGAEGEYFCAGGDLKDLHGELTPDEAKASLTPMKNVLESIVKFPVPVIALLNGNALGGGCELATACDIRIAKEGTVFGFIQSNIGILPGWGGGAILHKKVGSSFAMDWLMRGQLYGVNELLIRGWLHHVVKEAEWEKEVTVLEPYIKKSIKQMRLLKAQFQLNIDINGLSSEMEVEMINTADLWGSPEHRLAVRKFLSRKK